MCQIGRVPEFREIDFRVRCAPKRCGAHSSVDKPHTPGIGIIGDRLARHCSVGHRTRTIGRNAAQFAATSLSDHRVETGCGDDRKVIIDEGRWIGLITRLSVVSTTVSSPGPIDIGTRIILDSMYSFASSGLY